jgi:hypothetical protein
MLEMLQNIDQSCAENMYSQILTTVIAERLENVRSL